MSARKINSSDSISNPTPAGQTRLSLSANAVRVRKNGIEFISKNTLPTWSEMMIDLESPGGKKVHCTGVVVACQGSRHAGYNISMLFTNIPRQSQQLLNTMTSARV